MFIRRYATVSPRLYRTILSPAIANVLVSVILLVGAGLTVNDHTNFLYAHATGLFRGVMVYDTMLLGCLVFLTGGAEESVFAPQFAALLPIATLVRDDTTWKLGFAAFFLLMFVLGLMPTRLTSDDEDGVTGPALVPPKPPATLRFKYRDGSSARSEKRLWFIIFFIIFIFFPTAYDYAARNTETSARTSASVPP